VLSSGRLVEYPVAKIELAESVSWSAGENFFRHLHSGCDTLSSGLRRPRIA